MEVGNPTLATEAGETPPTSDQEQELLRSDRGDSREAKEPESFYQERSDTSTPEQASKRARAVAPSYKAVAGTTRVGLIPPDYPSAAGFLEAVPNMPDRGPQVRFQGFTHRSGWLQITCADDSTLVWLEGATKDLKPWVGTEIRVVKGVDLPIPHVYVMFLHDDKDGQRLAPEEVLLRLRKMNHGLNTREWIILHRESSGMGQTWTSTTDP
ncbi:unnamed protein product [Ceutorhynchus assimilis]|uniref:DUF4780 domain-containing protein n=1 Tax=Ceutorhynchus assimilis TaxID=467358 RepID=A0A9N9MX34_9CUCU|nr:unnamed protein product [Ceutorhynchus assimilis]